MAYLVENDFRSGSEQWYTRGLALPDEIGDAEITSAIAAFSDEIDERTDDHFEAETATEIVLDVYDVSSRLYLPRRARRISSVVTVDTNGLETNEPGGFPTVRSTSTGAETTNVTSHAVLLPEIVAVGDLLLVWMTFDGAPTVTWDNVTAGTWTVQYDTANGTDVRGVCYAKVADGTEDGLTLTITSGASEQSVYRAVAYRDWRGTLADGLAVGTAATGADAAPNPPQLNPTWGVGSRAYIAAAHTDGIVTASGYPASYTINQFNESSGGGAGCGLASAKRERTTGSPEDPTTFTLSGADEWVAQTLVVRPPAARSAFRFHSSLDAAGTTAVGDIDWLEVTRGQSLSSGSAWPIGTATVKITGDWYWASPPDRIRQAVALLVWDHFTPEGDVLRRARTLPTEYGNVTLDDVPTAVSRIVAQFRRQVLVA